MTAFYLKYRPQKIAELDLGNIRDGLSKVVASGSLPHALLFAGPRGTGKTSAARIIAKVANCTGVHPESRSAGRGEPCNACDQCLSIIAGTNLDVLEIDAASNRGIDDIRSLREKIKLAPISARFKVYIIDEAQMLTTEAFNALLKTLEEPPKHAIFILCTTQPEKLPETIISRCMRFNFKRASIEEIVAKLEKIVALEKIDIEPKVLVEIAKAVSGSFRDAQKILEQASFAGGEITAEQIKEILGQTVGLEPEKLLGFLVAGDTKGAIKEINRVVESGGNLRVYTEELLEVLRAGLLAKIGVPEWDDTEALKVTETLKVEDIKTLIEIFSRTALELRDAVIPQLPLEMAVVEWCENSKRVLVVGGELSSEGEDEGAKKASSPTTHSRPITHHPSSSSTNVSLKEIQARWREVLLGVRPKNHSVEALLRATRPISFEGKILTIEVFYQFHKDQLELERNRRVVEEVVTEIFGTPLGLKCILGKRIATAKTQNDLGSAEISASQRPDGRRNSASSVVPGNGETTDEDIIKVAEEIFKDMVE